ncbi:Serine/threonine/tyrosine-interacting-like protein 1 [Microbotryomycetes sp. JL221]|nr:Serine/threonine/tyrosine-interacting-like protein 1 [Microbotryomycetes sp. JL221]
MHQFGQQTNGFNERGTDGFSLEPLGAALPPTAQNDPMMPTTQMFARETRLDTEQQSKGMKNGTTNDSSTSYPSPPLSAHDDVPRSQPCLKAHSISASLDTFPRLQPSAIIVDKPTTTTAEPETFLPALNTPAQQISLTNFVERLERDNVLVIDVRNVAAFEQKRIKGSINVNMPSLLLKRFRRGNTSCFALESFVTTDLGKDILDHKTRGKPHIDLVIIGDQTETRDPESLSPGCVLLSVLETVETTYGALLYTKESFEQALVVEPRIQQWIVQGELEEETPPMVDESSHRTNETSSLTPLPQIQPPNSPGQASLTIPHTPNTPSIVTPPQTPTSVNSASRSRPRLKRIDTSESLLTAPRSRASSGSSSNANSRSPAATVANLRVDPTCANNSNNSNNNRSRGASIQSVCSIQTSSARSPGRILGLNNNDIDVTNSQSGFSEGPGSSQGFIMDPSDVEAANSTEFDVSTIIDGLLYLGPEPAKMQDLDELDSLGVRVVVNLAIECEDLAGETAKRFELKKVPMRDVVDEKDVQQSFETACDIIQQAHDESKPVYCHCRAGKSRSVAIVLSYLVKSRSYSLKRAYDLVSSRRQGISPNIGFLGELLLWEQKFRGSKSKGLFGVATPGFELESFVS